MTWIRSLKAMGKYPLYLIITILGVLPVLVMLIPLTRQLSILGLDLLKQATLYDVYHAASTEATNLLADDLAAIASPGMTLLVLILADAFLFRPLSLQFIGDAAAHDEMPANFGAHGLRRLWWRPTALRLMELLIALFIYATAPVPLTLAVTLSRILGSDILFWAIPVVFVLVVLALYTLVQLVTYMALAASAQEGIGLFRAIGRAFRRTFHCLGRLLGAFFSSIGVFVIPLYLIVSLLLFFAAPYVLTGTALDMNRGQLLETVSALFDSATVLILVTGLFAWMRSSFLTSYCAHLTVLLRAEEAPVSLPNAGPIPEETSEAAQAPEASLPQETPAAEEEASEGEAAGETPEDKAEP